MPSIGRLKRFRPPAEGPDGHGALVRNDTGVREGDEISIFYDPMIAKLITHAPDRIAAIDAHARALDRFLIEGFQENSPFLAAVMGEPTFRSGEITTGYIKTVFPEGFRGLEPDAAQREALVAAAAYAQALAQARAVGDTARMREDWAVILDERETAVSLQLRAGGADIAIDGGPKRRLETAWRPGERQFAGALDGHDFALRIQPLSEGFALAMRGISARAIVASPRGAALRRMIPPKPKADTSRLILSPMPGLVVSIDVTIGQEVKAGEGVAIVEAMKMQNVIRAERDGVVAKVAAAPGAAVAADEVLVELA